MFVLIYYTAQFRFYIMTILLIYSSIYFATVMTVSNIRFVSLQEYNPVRNGNESNVVGVGLIVDCRVCRYLLLF